MDLVGGCSSYICFEKIRFAIIYVLQAIRICLACNGCCLEVRVQMGLWRERSSPDMDERIRFQEWSCQARASRMFFGYKSIDADDKSEHELGSL